MKFFAITSILGLLLLGAFTNALPNPAPEPEAAAITGGEIEIVARDEAQPAVLVPKLKAREAKYCWRGWNKPNFVGDTVEFCCYSSCCYFKDPLANDHLFSAKATASPNTGINLWTSPWCNGQSRWVDFEGWGDLASAPAYYSMSL